VPSLLLLLLPLLVLPLLYASAASCFSVH